MKNLNCVEIITTNLLLKRIQTKNIASVKWEKVFNESESFLLWEKVDELIKIPQVKDTTTYKLYKKIRY